MEEIREGIINSDGYYPQCPYCFDDIGSQLTKCPNCAGKIRWETQVTPQKERVKIPLDCLALLHALCGMQWTGKMREEGKYTAKDFEACIAHYKGVKH